MKIVSILCTVVLLALLALVLPETKRDGFVILLDETYRAEITAGVRNSLDFPPNHSYDAVTDAGLRRAVEREEHFTPDAVFQTPEAVYITDSKRGKLSRYKPSEGLRAIAIFGGKLQHLDGIDLDRHGNIRVSIQFDSISQTRYLVKLDNSSSD